MAARRDLRSRRATKANIMAFANEEHERLFGTPWRPGTELALLSFYQEVTPRGEHIAEDAPKPVGKYTLQPAQVVLLSRERKLSADRKRVSAALDALRRDVLALTRLAHELYARWGPRPVHDDPDDFNFETLESLGVETVDGKGPRFLGGALERLDVYGDPPPWRASRPANALETIASNARYNQIYQHRELTNHEMGILSLLCDCRPRGRQTDTVDVVVKRAADAMRRARGRIARSNE